MNANPNHPFVHVGFIDMDGWDNADCAVIPRSAVRVYFATSRGGDVQRVC